MIKKWAPYFLITISIFAEPLTPKDFHQLEKKMVKEHILYETYLETDKGLASVFGYQFDTYFNQTQCFILAISGAVGGERGGYGFAAFGLGQLVSLTQGLHLNLRVFLGSGGGGGLDAGGGLMMEGHIGLIYSITPTFSFEINTGYLKYPTGTFETPMINLGLSMTDQRLYLPW